jgi:AraC-like DNA-binding protein
MKVVHSPAQARRAPADHILLCRQGAGRLVLEQAGRENLLEAGDMTILDPRLPHTGDFRGNSELLVVKVPRRQIEARIGPVHDIAARRLRSAGSSAGLTSAFLSVLPSYAESLESEAADTVKNQILDLISLSILGSMRAQPPTKSAPRSLVRLNVLSAIEARLHDPRLDPTAVAAAAGVSLRYANSALADDCTSVLQLILGRRLARCRSALGDPTQSHRSISDIAFSWGFTDMTHFGRKFRSAFGMLPSEFRRSTNGPDAFGARRIVRT